MHARGMYIFEILEQGKNMYIRSKCAASSNRCFDFYVCGQNWKLKLNI